MSVDGNKTFTFKLYVFKNHKEAEIRKFSLKTDELSFEKMEEILEAIFPNLNQSKFTLLWKDQVDDMITLSTSKEFSTFEEHITKSGTDEEIKLFINLEDELYAISQKFEHIGLNLDFSCKSCQKNIIPKCLDCSKQNLAHEHKILNIVDQSPGNINRTEVKGELKIINKSTTSSKPISNLKASDQSTFVNDGTGFRFGSSNFQIPSNSNTDIKKNGPIFGSPGASTNLFK